MKVSYKDLTFNTDDMRAFDTGMKYMPRIWVNESGLCFAERHREGLDIPKYTYMSQFEARSLADACKMQSLKECLRAFQQK